MAFIEFHADMQTVAQKIVEAGENEFCEFMDCLVDAINERYAQQLPINRQRFEVFYGRMSDEFGTDTRAFFKFMAEAVERK